MVAQTAMSASPMRPDSALRQGVNVSRARPTAVRTRTNGSGRWLSVANAIAQTPMARNAAQEASSPIRTMRIR